MSQEPKPITVCRRCLEKGNRVKMQVKRTRAESSRVTRTRRCPVCRFEIVTVER